MASVAPWILFWGWVALDSALAYRKSQAALDQAAAEVEAEMPPEPEPAPEPQPRGLRWPWPSRIDLHGLNLDGLREVKRRTRAAMIGAPIIAVLGPLLLGKLLRRNKP